MSCGNNTYEAWSCPVYYQCSKGCLGTLFLPIINESEWSAGLRGFFYFVAMIWCFMGVAIAADLFMCAIEIITSKTKKIRVATEGDGGEGGGYEEIEIRVWNDTVANLSLMALGSSAPEILLSIIEIVGNNFEAGELGPGTIVGSAAFNLLVITACCVMAIPDGQVKRINSFGVFLTTAFFSVFAYIWMFIVLQVSSKGEVEIWEAAVTFLLFAVLVILAYIADKELCINVLMRKRRKHEIELNNLDLLNENVLKKHHPDLIEYMREITANPNISEAEAAKLIAIKIEASKKRNYGYYRVGALRQIGGSRKVVPKVTPKLQGILEGGSTASLALEVDASEQTDLIPAKRAKFNFTATAVSVMENNKIVQLGLERTGNLSDKVSVIYETIDGTAEAGSDYIAKKDTLTFGPNETHQYIEITIIDDYEWEPDETFFVKLHIPEGFNDKVEIGHHSIAEVTIINDDEPGTLEFNKPSHIMKESCGQAQIEVERTNGADGKIEVTWKTKDQSALHGKDFIGGEGTLIFDHGETIKTIDIEIVNDHMFEKDETFMIELLEVKTPGAKLGRLKRSVVTIVSDDEYQQMFDRVVNMAHVNLHKYELGSETWGQQFSEAMNVNGGEIETASIFDYVMHFITFFWKVVFACVPPVTWCGGWLAFCIILAMIGVLTAIIGDIATVFGCLVGLKKEVTAFTFVALGTSLPDLFASRTAARNEKYADASIGNVTGSNGVNVFLGLGIPWLIASIYHAAKGTKFLTDPGSLATNVVTYSVCATVCIVLLIIRRFAKPFGGGELGGPPGAMYGTGAFMISLWFLYVIISALVSYKHLAPISF